MRGPRCRTGEGVQLGGWDGLVRVERGNAFVPDGASAWEVGTGGHPKQKADEDYEKRKGDRGGVEPAAATFIFVTPRRWAGKAAWVEARRSESVWRDVRAYDADDIEAWLDLAPAVHVWISSVLGRRPPGAVDLETHWADWSEVTVPATPAALLLAGRGDTAVKVRDWLSGPSAPTIALKAGSRDEAMAVFAAVVLGLPDDAREAVLSRCVVVRTLDAWETLCAGGGDLLLIPDFEVGDAISRATRRGHRVLVPLGRSDGEDETTLNVPRLGLEEAQKALRDAGCPEADALEFARTARGSLTSFRRRVAVRPEVRQPEWARPDTGSSLLATLLAGGWEDARPADRAVLSRLAGKPYEELGPVVGMWSREPDPPLRSVAGTWHLTSRDDAWTLLARHLQRDDLLRFEAGAVEVLSAADPRFDLEDGRAWAARLLGQQDRCSDHLRHGIAETLAVMGARGDAVPVASGVTARDLAAGIVRRVLGRANEDWRVWATLSGHLPFLAEAAPDEFLGAVEAGLAGDAAVLLRLFSFRGDPMFGPTPHVGLIHAIETLVWSPNHFGRAVLVLGRLARLDPAPEGRVLPRPATSLEDVFRPWLPQTSCGLERRLGVLDRLREREPDVAWRLMRGLLPRDHDVGQFTAVPCWRDWGLASVTQASRQEHVANLREVVRRMLDDAGEDGRRWVDLLGALAHLPEDLQAAILDRVAPSPSAWHALRGLLSRHRSSLSPDVLGRIEKRYEEHTPGDPVARFAWLFTARPPLPGGRHEDMETRRAALEESQLNAVRAVHSTGGTQGMLDLCAQVERPDTLGWAFGRFGLIDGEDLLRDHLASADGHRARFAQGFAQGRGTAWVKAKLEGEAPWPPAQAAALLVCLPAEPSVWDLAERLGAETESVYWRSLNLYAIRGADVGRGTRKLLDHGRPYSAVEVIAAHLQRGAADSALAAEALEQVLKTPPGDDPPIAGFEYGIAEVLDLVAESDEARAARLEWAFLEVVLRDRDPKALHRLLAADPGFFAEVVEVVYVAEGEDPSGASERDQRRARTGHHLLDSWRRVPGMKDEGSIDPAELKEWVRRAREACSAKGRGKVGDQGIGAALSGSPEGPDGAWPHPAVRDVIEDIASEHLETGLEVGLCNSRGATWSDGGKQEHALADQYERHAVAVSDHWPRSAAMLRHIAAEWRRQARLHEAHGEDLDDLGR